MDVKKIRELVDMVAASDIAELEVETDELSLRIRKQGSEPSLPIVGSVAPPVAMIAASAPVETIRSEPVAASVGREVTSPIVGTFYRSPDPGSAPFVTPGQVVKPGDTLCIVEAMKVMNEIEAEFGGTVLEVCMEDGQPVEAEAVLLRIDPA